MSQGIRFMLYATLFYAGMNWCIKYLQGIPSHEVVFFRSIVTLVFSYVLIRRKNLNPWGNNKKLLIYRGLAGFIGLTFYIYTVQRMSLASAVTIQYLAPIFTAIFAIFLLGDRLRWPQWLLFGVAFSGVLLIKGYDPTVDIKLLLFGIISAIGSALAYNFISMLKGKDDPIVIVFYFPLVTLPCIGPWLLFDFVWPSPFEWAMLLATGLFTQYAQLYMTRAYQLEKVSNVSILSYLGTIYALIIGVLVFNESYPWQALLGIGLIVGSVISSIILKTRAEKIHFAK
ncbi:MAG: DMT family transporter [Bacteroidetes bacterium]|nr:DMT family transporter [Bacteroidota bacterium]